MASGKGKSLTVSKLLAVVLLVAAQACAGEALLDALTWSQRVLLIFAPDDPTPELNRQRRVLAEDPGMLERDLVVIEVINATVTVAGSAAPADAGGLRKRFEIEPAAFAVILVGKDGSEKRRSSAPLAACDLYATIDAMPMRRREMAVAGQQAVRCSEGKNRR